MVTFSRANYPTHNAQRTRHAVYSGTRVQSKQRELKTKLQTTTKNKLNKKQTGKRINPQSWKAKAKANRTLKNDNFLTSKKNPVCNCNVQLLKRVLQIVARPTNRP